jgi:signal transduction histidine kinase
MPDWQIVALKSEKDAFRSLAQVGFELLLLGLLLSIPIVLGIRWLSGKLTDPVHELTDFVTGIATRGDLAKRASIRTQDELGTLAMAFNQMTENLDQITSERERFVLELEELNRTLEQKVTERTLATELANADLTKTIQALKSTQGQLVHAEKMASLGQLVAGVAHELNNPVGFIYANFPQLEGYVTDLLALVDELSKLPLDETSRKLAEQMLIDSDLEYLRVDILDIIRSGKSGAFRIKEIVSSLRSFSRLDEAELKNVLLEDGLNDTLAILGHQTRGRIQVLRDYQLNQPVLCFAGQINQVFMNIIYNGIQAIQGEGTLTIATRREDEWAIITIMDSGAGIPDDIIGKIFDPFFTTKKIGEGTGLGLSISYGIVQKQGGRIDVESSLGKGTCFTIRLLLSPKTQTREAEATVNEKVSE